MSERITPSPEQQVLLDTYDTSLLGFDPEAIEEGDVENCDDGLFLFLWNELAPDGGTDRAAYITRMRTALEQVREVFEAL